MIIDNIILFISIVNFILTLFVFLNAKELKQHASFIVFSLITTLWLFDNFLLKVIPIDIFVYFGYGLGVLVGTFGLIWVYDLVEERVPKILLYAIIPFSILVFFISSFTSYVAHSFSVSGLGFSAQKGFLFTEYAIYISFLLLACLYKLTKKSLQEEDIFKKKQILVVLTGCLIYGFTVMFVDFFMPIFFSSFAVVDLDNLAYFIFLLFIIYSITKYNLFGIKIIITQLLMVIFLSLLLLNFLFSTSLGEYIRHGVLFFTSILISYAVIKSMFLEIEISRKLLEETKKNLMLEKQLSRKIADISGQVIGRLEKELNM